MNANETQSYLNITKFSNWNWELSSLSVTVIDLLQEGSVYMHS